MKNLNLIIIIFTSLVLFSCSSNEKDRSKPTKEKIRVERPTDEEFNEIANRQSFRLRDDRLRIPQIVDPMEKCDGIDNNNNGYIDEGCCRCCQGAPKGDFNCDQSVTLDGDCGCPLLLAYNKTIWIGNPDSCADLTGDGNINLNDVKECIRLAH